MAFATGEAKWGPVADRYARQYGVDPALFRRLVTQESGWNPNAASGAGARGLTQVVPRWHPDADLSTPESQLNYGAKHFGSLLKKYGNPRDALAVYNSGKPWATSQAYGETRNYVTRILGGYKGAGQVTPATQTAQSGVDAWSPQGGTTTTLPGIDPASAREIGAYMRQSEADVLAGRNPADIGPLAQRIISRRRSVVDTALTAVGAAGFPGGEQQGVVDGASDPVNAAKGVLGTPYSWGGGTPSGPSKGFGRGANTVGFDCSSLVQYAWAKAGVQLPRTTYQQIHVGRGVSTTNRAQWLPGDLMFPSTGHVQMYVGNGKVIEAPRTGGRVQIVPARSSYIAVRRPK